MTRKLTPYHTLLGETRRAKRRRDAVNSVKDGATVAEVARQQGVSRQTLYTWLERSEEFNGDVVLKPHGRPSLLSDEQRQTLANILQYNLPEDFGYLRRRWTLESTRQLIRDKFGVKYSSLSSVSMLLKAMNISLRDNS